MWTVTKSMGASVLGLLGMALLVAGKSTAGLAFVCSAVLIVLPLNRLIQNKRTAVWLRVAVIAVLCTIAIQSIASTDIVPEQETTGYVFVDQLAAILRRFQENVFGNQEMK